MFFTPKKLQNLTISIPKISNSMPTYFWSNESETNSNDNIDK